MQLSGKIVKVGELETFSDKFQKVTVLLEQKDVKYDAVIPIDLINKQVSEIAVTLKEGDNVTFDVNIAGREWKEKYFVSIKAWKCTVEEYVADNPTYEQGSTTNENGLPF